LEPWAIELNGPSGLVRQGWKPKTLTPGMPVTLTIHPLKDGTHGGQFMAVKLPDGTQLGVTRQTKDVRKGSLDKKWGDAANAAAAAAAADIVKLIPH
jgi:hypothetical protein